MIENMTYMPDVYCK